MMRLVSLLAVLVIAVLSLQASPVTMSGRPGKGIRSDHGHGTSANGGITYNILNFGGVCNGVNDDGPAIVAVGVAGRAFQAANPGAPVTLVFPPGANCLALSCPNASDTGASFPFEGIINFTWIATNATFTARGGGNCQKYNRDIQLNPPTTFYFNSSNVGDTCVTMVNAGTEASYPVGLWVIVAGQGMQVNSFPPNYAKWEFAQVQSKPAGKVCFTQPLKNAYPITGSVDLTGANCGGTYCGGPGALVLLVSSWGGYFHVIGGTWRFDTEPTWIARNVIFDNATFAGVGGQTCWFPSVSGIVTFNNSSLTNCSVEVDKEIDQLFLNNSAISNLIFQSASVNNITLTNGSSANLTGTPLQTSCNSSTLTSMVAGNSFGSLPQSFAGINCNIAGGITAPAFANGNDILTSGSASAEQFFWDGHGNIIGKQVDVYSGNPDYPPWISNGGRMRMRSDSNADADNYLTIVSSSIPVTGATSSTLTIATNLTGSFGANLPPPNDNTINWIVDPVRNFTCTGCFGSQIASDLNFLTAQNKPLWSYLNRTYTCVNNIPNVTGSLDIKTENDFQVNGTWISAVINVLTPDTNVSDASPLLNLIPGLMFNTSTGATTFNHGIATANLLLTGTRTVFTTSTLGALTADTLLTPALFNQMAGSGGSAGVTSSGITNGSAAQCPVVNVIWQTDRT